MNSITPFRRLLLATFVFLTLFLEATTGATLIVHAPDATPLGRFAARVGEGVKELLAHRPDVAQVMMLGQEPAGAGLGFGSREQLDVHSGPRR